MDTINDVGLFLKRIQALNKLSDMRVDLRRDKIISAEDDKKLKAKEREHLITLFNEF